MTKRVVITGMGIISPIGNDIETVTKNLKEGYNGLSEITDLSEESIKVHFAGYCKDFDPSSYIDKKEIKRMDRFSQLGIASAIDAVEDSKIDFNNYENDRIAIIMGTSVGGFSTIENEVKRGVQKGMNRISPATVPMMMGNRTSTEISIKYDLHGETQTPISACSTGANAIMNAYRAIKDGYSDVAIAGGSDAVITEVGISSFQQLRAVSTSDDINRASIPFDKNRNGFVMGEGAGALVLEEYESAKMRGAKIYAEIIGASMTSDGYHMTAPDPSAKYQSKAIINAIKEAQINPSDIDYINAHGTATQLNDIMESKAIKLALGDFADEVDISSTKSMTGHMLGAAGVAEAIFSVIAITNNFIPPTINLREVDPALSLNYTPNKRKDKKVNIALSNSYAFGGINVSLILKGVEDA